MRRNIPGEAFTTEKTILVSTSAVDETTPSRPSKTPPYLIIIDGPHAGAYFPLKDGKNIIGRAVEAGVRLEDHSVSRNHAELERTETGLTVRDLGSKNGTSVNGSAINDTVVIGHKDIIKTGIYLFRLITQAITAEEEMSLPPEIGVSERTVMADVSPDVLTSTMNEKKEESSPPEFASSPEESAAEEMPEIVSKPASNLRKFIVMGAGGLVIVAMVGYLTWKYFLHPAKAPPPPPPPTEFSEPQAMPAEGGTPGTATGQIPGPAPVLPEQPKTIPVFLDFASSPLPATVMFQDKELGKTPVRANVELELGKSYTAEGVFFMPELQERYTLPVNFTVSEDTAVIPVLLRGPIGMIKVNNLPRDVQFYLEGSYEYDRFKERPAKLNEVVLQKPIYIPYGRYQVELRRSRQLGESQTFVQDIIFKREFSIAEDQPTYILDVKDEDLKVFPADIKSDPSGADVFVDGKFMGKTPYQGLFPLGDHSMALRKDGYFENTQQLRVDINTTFTANIKLDTSVAGAHLNNAKAMFNRELYQQAVNELAQGLASNPTPSETAQANYLLGRCYLSLGDASLAMTYFGLSREVEEWKYPSMLGQVAAYTALQKADLALPALVEVLLKAQDENIKKEAHILFQQMSPMRSIIYAYTEPAGARVTVNDKQIEHPTPVILHDLPLGSYKLKFEKPGYQPLELKLTLSVNEFNPVIVTLKPIAQ